MDKNKCERRLIEVRAVGTEEKMQIEGYALVFDAPATHTWGEESFTEVIKRGALDKTDMKDVPLRYNHNDSWMIMARTRNKSLELIVDEKGLLIKATLIETQSNRDAYKAIQEGLIDKMSFAFTLNPSGDTWTYSDDYKTVYREITDIERLWDVSVVDTPFYDATSIYARSFELLDSELRRLDSLSEAKALKEKITLKGKF